MKRRLILVLILLCPVFVIFGQSTSVTNNNTITIQGNVYYFQPSTTPSSPLPTQSSVFLGSGIWYGENAARAWASIADWVIDRHVRSTFAVIGNDNEIVYITAVHVFRQTDSNYRNYGYGWESTRQVRIDYWVVKRGSPMADGIRATRWFDF